MVTVGNISIMLLLATSSHAMAIADQSQSICGEGFCGKISYDEITYMYRGLFFTEEQIREKEQKIVQARRKNLNNEGLDVSRVFGLPGDGDSCCATEFTHVKYFLLPNIDGIMRYIVHMQDASPPRYQLIPEGSCIDGYGNCDGHCFMEPLTLNLLVYDLTPNASWPPLTFDWFEVPGYCSCKNALKTVNETKLFSNIDGKQPQQSLLDK